MKISQRALQRAFNALARLLVRRAALLEAARSCSTPADRIAIAREICGLNTQIEVYRDALAGLGKLEMLRVRERLPTQLPDKNRDWHIPITVLRHCPGLQNSRPETVRVVHVIDGDSIRLSDGRVVRYIGIDAPEMVDIFGKPEPWAQESADANARLVAGRVVRLERETSDTDHHGRLLRHVLVGDRWVNGELVRLGMATTMSVPPDVRYQAHLMRLQIEAQHARRGLWSEK